MNSQQQDEWELQQEADRASRVENMREESSLKLHNTITNANGRLSKQDLGREELNDVVQERNAAMIVMRERAHDDINPNRRLTKDMARTVDVFNPEGPAGYRAKSAPDAELRATREEAVLDEARWLDSPERLIQPDAPEGNVEQHLQPKSRERGGIEL